MTTTTAPVLTFSQDRIARLAAAGRSNAEIASVCYVTVSTVEQHLTRVYRKLGVGSRTEIAAALPTPSDARTGQVAS